MATKKKKKAASKKTMTAKEKLTQKALAKLEREAGEKALELYLSSLGKFSDKKFGTFIKSVGKSGFESEIMKLSFSEVASAVVGSAPAKRKGKAKKSGGGGKRTRLSAQAKKDLMDGILKQVKKAKEPVGKADIATALGEEAKRLLSRCV